MSSQCKLLFHPLGLWETAGAIARSEQSVLGVQGGRSGLSGNTWRNTLCSLQACEKVIIYLNSSFLCCWVWFFQVPWHFRSGVFIPTVKRLWCLFNQFINEIVLLSAVTSPLIAEFVKANFKKGLLILTSTILSICGWFVTTVEL